MLKWLIGLLLLALEPILELIKEHTKSWLWGAVVTASLLLFRAWEKKARKKSSARLEAKVDLLLAERGIPWDADSIATRPSALRTNPFYGLRGRYFARTARKKTKSGLTTTYSRREKSMVKDMLSGKKKWIALVLSILLNGANETLGLGISSETIAQVTDGATVYIVIEGVVDVVRAITNHLSKKTGGVSFEGPADSFGSHK